MPNFYFLNYSYNPNTAATNRMLAYMKGLSELGISTNVLFFLTDKRKSKMANKLPHITVEYCWDKWYYVNNKYLKHLCYAFFVLSFFFRVKAGDTVYMYNMADMLHLLLKKKGVRIFVEKTEHPSMYALGSKMYHPSISQYFKDCSKATWVITVSTSLRHLFSENGVNPQRISIINMMVDENRFENVSPSIYNNPYFAYCGTISTFKDGVDILLKAFYLVCQKYADVELRIAGTFASKEDERILKDVVTNSGISGKALFMGIISAVDMPSFLVGAEAVVLSRPDNIQAQCGFPGKLGEYLLSKSPAIVTAVGDIPLFVNDGMNGFLVEPDNVEAFAEKMIWVIEHPMESKMIGAAGADLAHEAFNYLKETKKLIDFMNVR